MCPVSRETRTGCQVGAVAATAVCMIAASIAAGVFARTLLAAEEASDEAGAGQLPELDRSPAQVLTPSATPPQPVSFTIAAGGDVLLHLPVLASARRVDGSYDFAPLLAPLDPWVRGADLALCHLEVPLVPEGLAPSGYPRFGSPADIVPALRSQGWDGCSTASNHAMDQGRAGVTATLDALDEAGLGHVGTARSEAEADQPQLYVLERAGQQITVAHLAATYGTNGIPVAHDEPWSVTLIDADVLAGRAARARAQGGPISWSSASTAAPSTVPNPRRSSELSRSSWPAAGRSTW